LIIYDILFTFQYQVSTTVMDFVAVLPSLYLCLRCCVCFFDATVFSVNKDLYIVSLRSQITTAHQCGLQRSALPGPAVYRDAAETELMLSQCAAEVHNTASWFVYLRHRDGDSRDRRHKMNVISCYRITRQLPTTTKLLPAACSHAPKVMGRPWVEL